MTHAFVAKIEDTDVKPATMEFEENGHSVVASTKTMGRRGRI